MVADKTILKLELAIESKRNSSETTQPEEDEVSDAELALGHFARNPFGNREWEGADKPFQAYSACFELYQAWKLDNPENYISHIPIALDGSCSGIQVLSCCFRDEIGGANVNLLPTDKPADIYQVVADKTIAKLKLAVRNANCSETGQEEDEVSDAELAQWWLDYGITRKVTKRNCMILREWSVNLLPTDKPSDIYQVVADKTNAKLKLAVKKRNSCETLQEEDEVSDAELAQWWLPKNEAVSKMGKMKCLTQSQPNSPHLRNHKPLTLNSSDHVFYNLLMILKCLNISKGFETEPFRIISYHSF